MLIARPAKRDKSALFSNDLRFDVLEGAAAIGGIIYDKAHETAALTINNHAFAVRRASDRPDEKLYQALVRVMTGGEKPPPNPYALKDSGSQTLALAEQVKQGFVVSRGDESFTFRKGSSRPFNLYRQGSDEPLGWVGQEKFWTTSLHMNLPDKFDAAFQVFLLVLLLNLTMQRLETLSSNT